MWGVLAAFVVVLHLGYLAFQMLGGLLALRDSRWLGPHLAAVGWGVVVVAMQWRCPLTMLEKDLMTRSGSSPYTGSFLDHYVFGTYLPEGSQPLVYSLHLVVIFAVYGLLLWQWRHVRRGGLAPL